jgi:PTH2 family peptidyl-tRNA hydrolase
MEDRKSKQIIVMRKDLNMRRGKQIAQGAHASMKFILDRGAFYRAELDHPEQFHSDIADPVIQNWMKGMFTKVCVSVDSESELDEIYNRAKEAGLICSMIVDAGLTEFNGVPTKTCCAIGPSWEEELQPITGHLKLL